MKVSKLTRKEEIKIKSTDLFRAKGYAATSMRDIAKAMEMEASSLYNHISSKQQILSELLIETAELYMTGLRQITSSKIPSIDKLERLIADHIQITLQYPQQVALISGEWIHLAEANKSTFLDMRMEYERKFKKTIKACIKDGNIQPVHIELSMFTILSTLRSLYSWTNKYKINPIELEKEVISMLLDGIRGNNLKF